MECLSLRRLAGLTSIGTGVALLAACTSMSSVPPGTPLYQVEAEYGRADYSCVTQDGNERSIWTQQPYGQYAWGTDVSADGTAQRLESLLTDERFSRLAQGTWTAEQLRCEFGPPAEISTVGLPSSSQVVWSYRYKQAGTWNSLMHVYLGTDGQRVTRFHPGPDPLFERDQFLFF